MSVFQILGLPSYLKRHCHLYHTGQSDVVFAKASTDLLILILSALFAPPSSITAHADIVRDVEEQ